MDSKEFDKNVKEAPTIPYVIFESVQARNERHIKRLIIIIAILIGLLFISNVIWLWFMYGTSFESYEVTADSNSNAYYNDIGNNFQGDVNNGGTDKSKTDISKGSTDENNAPENTE